MVLQMKRDQEIQVFYVQKEVSLSYRRATERKGGSAAS